jgi:hypothetical protein
MKKARCLHESTATGQRKLVNSRRLNLENGFDHAKRVQQTDNPSCHAVKNKHRIRAKIHTVKCSLSSSPLYCAVLKIAADEASFVEIDSLIGKCFILNNPHVAHRPLSWDGSR